ncbi:polysaccharide biosynthesis/export family protein [Beijerinckia indica]|uniref:Polysaccharide export protein n=1 Tax=Beijerinckia indica subsp. indica (strain ATCC 9039 / DSM 1715 / NCIMB 8712) TaxID=395963 RepID=B2IH72_BEII9|nr:polysaccharide biosynthesis/export family protein [Beijerinckia indica]ACB94485.1 polysaccharide export protein [Beijerinckia indica subsp. indica ATCC 9039]
MWRIPGIREFGRQCFKIVGALAWMACLLSINDPLAAAGRRLMPSDVLQIRVIGQPDLDTQARVDTDGTINFPYAGRLSVRGLSEAELGKRIAKILDKADVIKNPQVIVSVTTFGGQVSVLGAVGAPGQFVLDRPLTLAQALARAGGVRESAGTRVTIQRQTGYGVSVLTYDMEDVLSGRKSPAVFNNDNIVVEAAPVYFLYGFVGRAGQYPYKPGLSVQQALAIGGGISDLGSDWRIEVKRRLNDGTVLEAPVTLDDIVEANDTIIVNERWF